MFGYIFEFSKKSRRETLVCYFLQQLEAGVIVELEYKGQTTRFRVKDTSKLSTTDGCQNLRQNTHFVALADTEEVADAVTHVYIAPWPENEFERALRRSFLGAQRQFHGIAPGTEDFGREAERKGFDEPWRYRQKPLSAGSTGDCDEHCPQCETRTFNGSVCGTCGYVVNMT